MTIIVITKEATDFVNVHFTSLYTLYIYITLHQRLLRQEVENKIKCGLKGRSWMLWMLMVKFLESFRPGFAGFALLCTAGILEYSPRPALTPIHTRGYILGWCWQGRHSSVGIQGCTARMGMPPNSTSLRK
mmetsp:Transcript_2670/g.6117  ORF Transcript_2670/g.6117 Transcript_2670/m.6117 type:complete len:131 (-) Transcript_2670:580-972(-)